MRKVNLIFMVALFVFVCSAAFGAIGTTVPQLSIDASSLTAGNITTAFPNSGAAGGYWAPEGVPVVGTVAGLQAITFNGPNLLLTSDAAGTTKQNAPMSLIKLDPNPEKYTVFAWVYRQASGGGEAYMSWAPYMHGTCFQFIGGNNSGVDNWTAGGYVNYNPTPSRTAWHFVAVTYDGTTTKLYVDGALQGSGTNAFAADNVAANYPVRVGCGQQAADFATYTTINKIRAFGGSIAKLNVYDIDATAAEVTTAFQEKAAFISGQVTSGGVALAGATVYYKLSANASVTPMGSATTDASGNYKLPVLQNSGPYYIAAVKTGYGLSADYSPAPSVVTTDVTGINISIDKLPAITGKVTDGANVYNAAVVVNTSTDGGVTLTPSQTVYTNATGDYIAYAPANGTYYLVVKKSAHVDSAALAVAVAAVDVPAQNVTLVKAARQTLVDLQASSLATGAQTVATTWTNAGTLGGSFTANNAYTVVDAIGGFGRPAVNFTGATNINFKSSMLTSAAVWPSAIAGGDVQYSTVAWVYAPASTGTYLDFSAATGAARGTLPVSSSWLRYRYNTGDQWGCSDHGGGTWVGWTGSNTNSPASAPALNAWHMIVNTYDGKSEKLYVDGVKQSTTVAEAIVRTFSPVANNLAIGSTVGSADWFKGYVNRVQVFDQALADADVTQLWNEGNSTQVTISGIVSATSGVLANALVTVSASGSTVTTATTNASGAYTATVPSGITYSLVASKVGYVNSTPLSVVVASANVTGQNITLTLIPPAAISGQVTDQTSGLPIVGAKVYFSLTANATVAATYVATTDASGNYSQTVLGGTWFVAASNDSHVTSADITVVNAGVAVPGQNFALVSSGRNIPAMDKLLFSTITESLPTTQGAAAGAWPVFHPKGLTALAALGAPTVDVPDAGATWAMNHNGASFDGFKFANIPMPGTLAFNGATIVAAIKPIRTGTANNYQPVVSVFLGQLELCVRNGDGVIQVGRGGTDVPNFNTGVVIPDGQKTILALVVQPTGEFKVFANGAQVYSQTSTYDMTSLTAKGWWCTDINIGKGWNGDGWSSFNGDIGDVFVYKTTLTNAEVNTLQTDLAGKFGVTGTISLPNQYTLTTSAGAGGTITPAGPVVVDEGVSKTFTITANVGYRIVDVIVDGVSQGAVETVQLDSIFANHNISATFVIAPQSIISGQVTNKVTGLGIAGATIYFSKTANAVLNPAYTIVTDGSGNYSQSIYDGTYYVAASAANYHNSADATVVVAGNAAGVGRALVSSVRNIPQTSQLLFAGVTEALPAVNGTTITEWERFDAPGTFMPAINYPKVAYIDNIKWESNTTADGNGFHALPSGDTVVVNGATIVVAVKPNYVDGAQEYQEVVSVLLNKLSICINKHDGLVRIGRGAGTTGPNFATGYNVPNGQKTILSLVVQPTGEAKLYANGLEVWSTSTKYDMTTLTTTAWWNFDINIGKGWNGDGWSSFNGNIGDVFVYKTALNEADLSTLEQDLGNKFGVYIPTFIAVSGKVTTDDGVTPIAGVKITSIGKAVASALSAADGTYSLKIESGSDASISAMKDSYQVSYPSEGQYDIYIGTVPVGNIDFRMTLTNTITGVVKDADNNPIYNAIVQFGSNGPTAVTDVDGKYIMSGITPGPADMYADALGYADNTETVDASPAAFGVFNHDITLTAKTEVGVIENGSFEQVDGNGQPKNWVKYELENPDPSESFVTDAGFITGTLAGKFNQHTAYHFIKQVIPVVDGSTYNVYWKLNGETTGTNGIWSYIQWVTEANPAWDTNQTGQIHNDWPGINASGTWVQMGRYSRLQPPADTKYILMYFGETNSDGKPFYIDDVVVDRVGPDPTSSTITASADAGGSISPSGDVVVEWANNQTFTITPNSGYAIADVLVDGVSNAAAIASGSYTFSMVNASHTISATFKAAGKPVGANNKSILTDDKLIGKYVKIWGKIISKTTESYVISDGYSTGVTVNGVTALVEGDMAIVTGAVQSDHSVTP